MTKEHMEELHRVIKFVLEIKNIGLKICPEFEKDVLGEIIWILCGICDSTWGSNKDDGRSVTGYILYLLGVPIAWKSKAQCHVTLSSSEAEYVAISELVKEIQYVLQILESMKIKVKFPVKVYVDNIGAI